MRIKRLEICGFKSFVDKTTLTFTDPITSIIGPNGCGKSNIVDAIRWVMGEQSAKHLRGRAMEDVIFAGSESRGSAGMAEVSLTFDMQDIAPDAAPGGVPWGAAAPEEVTVTRRLFRAGDSEYLLNGVPCRLRDVVEFFLGTGVGSKAYAIIEQGRIGYIVSSRAEDRRTLIDEAAGITKYKARKKTAERRIEATRQHLLRVSDVIAEIETRLRSLRLQAAKAERYKRYKAELRDIELWSASQRFLGLLAEEKATSTALEQQTTKRDDVAASVAVNEAEVENERLAVGDELTELNAAKDALFELSNQAQLGLERSRHFEHEAESMAIRVEESRAEISELTTRAGEHAAAIAELEGTLASFSGDASTAAAAHVERQQAHEEVRQQLAERRRDLEDAGRELSAAEARIARNESGAAAAAARAEDLLGRLQTLETEDLGAAERIASLGAEVESLNAAVSGIRLRMEEAVQRRAELEARLQTLRAEANRGELALETMREEAHRRRSRLASLAEIQARYESFQRGVRAIMQRQEKAAGQGDAGGIHGVVADIVQPPPELEAAVEAVLGDRLGNIIVESHEVGVEAIEFLKSKSEGRSSFIPVALRPPRTGTVVYDAAGGGMQAAGSGSAVVPMPADTDAWPTGAGVRGPMLELIGYDRKYDRIASYLLGDVLVVENLQRALELWRQTQTTRTIVTLEGEVIDPQGVVTGGSREAAVAGVLEQKREMRELQEVVARLESDIAEAMARLVSCKEQMADTQQTLEELNATARADEVNAVSQQKDLDRASGDLQRLDGRREELGRQRQQLERTLEEVERVRIASSTALEEDGRVVARATAALEELRMQTEILSERVDLGIGELTSLKIAAAQAEDRLRGAQATLARLRTERAAHEQRIEKMQRGIEEDLARIEMLREDSVRLRAQSELQKSEAEARLREHTQRQAALEERSALLSRREADLRAARAEAGRLEHDVGQLQMRHQELTLKRSGLEEHIQTRYPDIVLAAVVSDYHLRPPVGPDEEARMKELSGLIDRMGEINLTAIEESEELQRRFEFLTTQRADLESAIGKLESAIDRINRASRRRFREVFEAVNVKFQEVFPRLFGGGRAHLMMTDDSDVLETGVDIVANPPGKKVAQNIELLSGGEKALTAVSLMFAIFLVKPSPFCLLDEVDAPLDEVNVGRFNEVIREMTDRSQFIIITHNQRTMEIADRLCGVTMEEPGVSKLVAVNLKDSKGERLGKARVSTAARAAA